MLSSNLSRFLLLNHFFLIKICKLYVEQSKWYSWWVPKCSTGNKAICGNLWIYTSKILPMLTSTVQYIMYPKEED